MRVPRIHTGQTLAEGAEIALEAGPSQHLARALRAAPGDEVTLFNGRGGEHRCTIASVSKKHVTLDVGEFIDRDVESPIAIHLGIGLSRGERMDWVLQKATELGASAITPLATERAEVKLSGERSEKKLRHWRQIATSACEQCGRNRLPDIHPITPVAQWASASQEEGKLVLHHRAIGTPLDDAPQSIAILVGPEGGLSEEEILLAETAGFNSLRLGPRVLRTETAPLAAISFIQTRWGDFV